MRVADVLARGLAEAGVRHAFGIPGGEVLTVIDALGCAGIQFITARHETSAGLMAQGANAANGAPAVLVATVGPGVANSVNAIANAYLDRVPMIVLTGAVDRPAQGGYTHQVFDQIALLRPLVKASFVAGARSAVEIIERALTLASAHPRGPVHIEVPMQVAAAEAKDAARADAPRSDRSGVDELGLRQLAEALSGAERPLVLAGLEAADAQVAHALAALLQAWPAPLLTTYKAKGVLDERDARCVGAIGLSPKADALVAPLIAAADVILLIGYDPVEMRLAYNQPFALTTRVFELAGAARDHAMHRADREFVGALAENLTALTRFVRRSERQCWPLGEPARVRERLRAAFAPDMQAHLSPLTVAEVLSRVLPIEARLTVDTGAHRIVLSQAVRANWPGQVLQSNGLCTMGYALPSAIGLSLASGRRVVAAMGDGGFDMVLGELATLRDLSLPVTIVVFDDSSLALIDVKQRVAGLARSGVWLGATDHVAIAEAFGGWGVRVHDAATLERALVDSFNWDTRFSLISCALERGAYTELL